MPGEQRTVFYSWQSDLPSKTNRGLIRDALDRAVERLSEVIDEPIRSDSDTQGVGGARDIHEVILEKLDRCDAAVFDVTPVASNDQRKLPNPNVMLELGYGLARPGVERLILVLNTAHARVEDLPFDIRNKPVKTYSMLETDAPANARNELAGKLRDALETILRVRLPVAATRAEQVVAAIRAGAFDRVVQLDEYYAELTANLRERRPAWSAAEWDQRVLAAYAEALVVTRGFVQVTNIALRLLGWAEFFPKLVGMFERLFAQSRRNREEALANQSVELHDFENLMTRELYVATVDCFLSAGRHAHLNEFFSAEFHVQDGVRSVTGPFWRVMSGPNAAVVRWAQREPPPQGTWVSPLGELHRRRFTSADGSAVIPFQRFRAAEILAFHRSDRDVGAGIAGRWWPCCMPYVSNGPPPFFEGARGRAGAEALAITLGLGVDLAALRDCLASARGRAVEFWGRSSPLGFDPDWIEPAELPPP